MHESLLLGTSPERLRGLSSILAAPGAPGVLEAALPDLLREGDDAVLAAVASGLSRFRGDPTGLRLLETLARRNGIVRAAALRALRGEHRVADPGATTPGAARSGETARHTTPGTARSGETARHEVAAARHEVATARGPDAVARASEGVAVAPVDRRPAADASQEPSVGEGWAAPFEAVLADPTPDRIARAALALMELSDARPVDATSEALRSLAGRLAMASFDHEGQVQQGLARLAKSLKGL